MENIKMSKDQFAKFVYEIGLNEIKQYNFDLFYDICTITERQMNYHKDFENYTQSPIKEAYYLFYRELGSHMLPFTTDEETFKVFNENNSNCFLLSFCWNNDYCSKESFVVVTKIK